MLLAHNIVGKKEEDIERQYSSQLKCKWIPVATIHSKFIIFDKSTHKLIINMTIYFNLNQLGVYASVQCLLYKFKLKNYS